MNRSKSIFERLEDLVIKLVWESNFLYKGKDPNRWPWKLGHQFQAYFIHVFILCICFQRYKLYFRFKLSDKNAVISQQTIISQAWARLLSCQHRTGYLIYLATNFHNVEWAVQRVDLQGCSTLTWVHSGASGLWLCKSQHFGSGSWLATSCIHPQVYKCPLASHGLFFTPKRSRF